MNNTEREDIETQIILRSTGELSPLEISALDELLERDAEAAEFARFVAGHLPARAPRDFVAAAIRETASGGKIAAFPHRRKLAAVAALAVAGLLAIRYFPPQGSGALIVATSIPARATADISARVDVVEAELAAARQRLAHGRYHRTRDLL